MIRALGNLDRRWIFLLMGIAVSIPFIRPIGFSIVPSREVISFHAAIDALDEGAIVYFAADLDPGSQAELLPMMQAFAHQVGRKKLRVVAASLWPAAPPLAEAVLNDILVDEYGYTYGTDFVNLGFKEGREAVMVTVAESVPAAFPSDYYGAPVETLSLMSEVGSFADIALLVNISAGYPGTKEWIQQVQGRYSIDLVSGCTAVSAPEYYPYIQADQLQGLLGGLAGAAEYEALMEMPGTATLGMDSQSLGHIAVIAFILAGNVLHLLGRRREGGA
jgi:hypothetical protein